MEEQPNVSDEALARQTQAGSMAAFEQLVHRYEHRVHAFASQFFRQEMDAKEVTQDTFVQAFQSIERFDARRIFAPWLFTIARRKCIDRHRAARNETAETISEPTDDDSPMELLARREEQDNLWKIARQRLGDNPYRAVWLHYAEDMNVAQIAQVLGKTRVHVKVMLFRARQILGRELQPKNETQRADAMKKTKPAMAVFTTGQASVPSAK